MHARKNALAADVVVVNHHLFFADVVLRDEGIAELLPACNTVIFDEAHQLPETARCSSARASRRAQLVELARDVRLELRAAGGASPELDARSLRASRRRRATCGSRSAKPARASAGAQALAAARLQRRPREAQFSAATSLRAGACGAGRAAPKDSTPARAVRARRATFSRRLRETEASAEVRWVEVFSHAVQLHVTPLSSAELFRRQMTDHPRAWIFTSATLAVGEDFGHFTRELGLADAAHPALGEPVRFRRAGAAVRAARRCREPNDAGFTEAVIEAALPVLEASGGRAFLLFTTLRALRRAHRAP